MTVDPALVTRKLMLILGDLDALRAIAAKGVAAYVGDRIDQAVVERYLERAVGRMRASRPHCAISPSTCRD